MKKLLLGLFWFVFGLLGFWNWYNLQVASISACPTYPCYDVSQLVFVDWTVINSFSITGADDYISFLPSANIVYDGIYYNCSEWLDLYSDAIVCFTYDWESHEFVLDYPFAISWHVFISEPNSSDWTVFDIDYSVIPECDSDFGSGENWSAIFLNDLQFPWKPLINISIPDYIMWDYTWTDDAFELYVGSGYDVEYIESIIGINSYRPTSEDFTDVFVSGLTLIMPYIVIVLFIVFVRKLIKRIFK